MKTHIAILIATCLLAACSTRPADLEAKVEPISRGYAENYQEIFRRVSNAARICQSGSVGAYASLEVDAQLYPDLGFGEISQSLVNAGIRNYFWTAKVERDEDSTKLTVHAGNTLNAAGLAQRVLRWADGDSSC